jgi:hypothetical protein
MKYIRTYESFKNSNTQKLNEEFVGNLFKGLKNKLSLGFSKMFGSASAVEKIIEEYKKEIISKQEQKKLALTALGVYFKTVKDGGEKDAEKIKELKNNIDVADKNYQEQVKLIKQKFDLKFNEAVKEEKNEKIKNFITLKKIEMQQELLQSEMTAILGDDLKPEDIEDEEFKKILQEIQNKTEESQKLAEEQKKSLEAKEEKTLSFDLEKAKQMAEKDETYLWEESPFKEYTFKKDDKIKFFSKSNKDETGATVLEDSSEERIKVKTEAGSDVEVNRGTVISSENFDKEKAEEKEKKEAAEKPATEETV